MAEVRTTSETGGMKGVKLERFDLIPAGPLRDLATLYGRGAAKYAEHNFRKGYEWSKSYSALQRHANAWARGESWDVCPVADGKHEDCITKHPETGESTVFKTPNGLGCYNHTGAHHMTAVAWHAFALREFEETHPDYDDRYITKPYAAETAPKSSHEVDDDRWMSWANFIRVAIRGSKPQISGKLYFFGPEPELQPNVLYAIEMNDLTIVRHWGQDIVKISKKQPSDSSMQTSTSQARIRNDQ